MFFVGTSGIGATGGVVNDDDFRYPVLASWEHSGTGAIKFLS